MAARPWVTPDDVKAYSDIKFVQDRDDSKLAVDISIAEQKVISMTNNAFDDEEKYPTIPEPVRTAVILLAEAIANNAVVRSQEKRIKSESFDDYSYTVDSGLISLDDLGILDLLSEYIVESGGNTLFRIRKL